MESLRELLLFGPGPSSSHTIAPYRIALDFLSKTKDMDVIEYKATLYGSLAFTGKGHLSDKIIKEAFKGYPCEVIFDFDTSTPHPNTIKLEALRKDGSLYCLKYVSLGGGSWAKEGEKKKAKDVYPFNSFEAMKQHLKTLGGNDIYFLVKKYEDKGILDYSKKLLGHAFATLEKSLEYEGYLPGRLHLAAAAKGIYQRAKTITDPSERMEMLIIAYAYALSEANARGEEVVTAPTCGSSGIVPSLLYYEYKHNGAAMEDLAKAFLVGAMVCSFIKENASVSGAVHGCQAECGSAASFAAASLCYLHGLSIYQTEYAAEAALEHFLGLTCDPVMGYVQIPCIERNGIAALHARASYLLAKNVSLSRKNRVSFDKVVIAMNETGNELPTDLKETSLGGLAKLDI